MKKSVFTVVAFLVSALLSVGVIAQEKKAKWAEMSAYHSVMSTTFHPAEEGNLKPIKERSGELVTASEVWAKSTPPKEFDKPGIKEKLEILSTESKALDKLVKDKATKDEAITASLTKLHDRFHEIVGLCTADDHKGNEHEGHGHEGHKH